ncbi:V-type ATP synthase subunit A [Alkalibacter rhizosphaerae]|uniref:V-type ATP synthase alpha chain n=1 Tax=Alkalibacter rhizosphaerae TaxID=2815577 RepID=A0A974XEQ5_9FIRM|nr:V-type ATP synthase subunit A [Alkalibacter rhizosphaerae]QSX08331.1 V-type ATP synthase subunit A [Alkalibacter rhizosphaerae]
MIEAGKITMINGPVLRGDNMSGFKMREMVMVGTKRLIGEVIILEGETGVIQVYEETEGLRLGEEIISTGKPLSVKLGPGMIGNIFDGIQRPLMKIDEINKDFIAEGIGLISLDEEKKWSTKILVKPGMELKPGDIFGEVEESQLITHRLMVPPGIRGEVERVEEDGEYTIDDILVVLKNGPDHHQLTMVQEWPVRTSRPVQQRKEIETLLTTGQRVLDLFFPLAKGGTCAIPGGFGTGKTMTQHQLAKWCDADIIIYIGCGERGNEMTEVLEDFPKLIDPKSNRPLMERTVLIANTSNMPVAAREASIYTGITMAEYYRDMGYDVAIMADSTSRWAEALREISGRLEEMPAEEGYPAYLSSRIAEFYERAGYVETLGNRKGSVTIIGAVSPAGGDFSEPVTENTKRYVNVFLGLDKELAYARHYPAINWLESYSGYIKVLEGWYEENLAEDAIPLRNRMLELLYKENKLLEIVMLVGEDVLPDDQRIILEISKIIKEGFLQQNAFNKEDTYVPLVKQYRMLKIMEYLYEKCKASLALNIPISKIKNQELFDELIKMKYTIPNADMSGIDDIQGRIDAYYDQLNETYIN